MGAALLPEGDEAGGREESGRCKHKPGKKTLQTQAEEKHLLVLLLALPCSAWRWRSKG